MVNTIFKVCRVTSFLFLSFIAFQVSAASSSSLSMAQAQSMEQQLEVQPAASAQQAPQRGIWVKLGKREADKELLAEAPVFVEKRYQGLLASIAGVHKNNLQGLMVSSEDQSKIKDLRALTFVQQQALGVLLYTDSDNYTPDIGCSLEAYEYLFNESFKRWINSSDQIRRSKRAIFQRVKRLLVAAYIRHFYHGGQIDVSKVWERLSNRKLKWNKQMMVCGNKKMSLRLVLINAIVAEACKHAKRLRQYTKELDEKMQKERLSLKYYASEILVSQGQGSEAGISVSNILPTPSSSPRKDNYIKRREEQEERERRAALMNTPNLQTNCARKLEPEFDAILLSDTPAPATPILTAAEEQSSVIEAARISRATDGIPGTLVTTPAPAPVVEVLHKVENQQPMVSGSVIEQLEASLPQSRSGKSKLNCSFECISIARTPKPWIRLSKIDQGDKGWAGRFFQKPAVRWTLSNCARKLESELDAAFLSDTSAPATPILTAAEEQSSVIEAARIGRATDGIPGTLVTTPAPAPVVEVLRKVENQQPMVSGSVIEQLEASLPQSRSGKSKLNCSFECISIARTPKPWIRLSKIDQGDKGWAGRFFQKPAVRWTLSNCAKKLESELDAAFLSDTPAPATPILTAAEEQSSVIEAARIGRATDGIPGTLVTTPAPAPVVEAPRKPEISSSAGSVELVQEHSLDKSILAPGKMKTFFRKPAVRWALFVAGAALCTAGGFGGQEVYRRYKAAQLLTKTPAIVHVSLLSRLAAFLIRCKTALVG